MTTRGGTMLHMRTLRYGAVVVAAALMIAFAASPLAADILDDWDTVKPPPRPELKPVTLEGSTTALLILDMTKGNCGSRPRCVATIPNVKRLHDAARAAAAMLWYSLASPAEVIDPGITPRDGEWQPLNGPD